MASINAVRVNPERTHGGAPAFPKISDLAQLRRSVLSCLLWESEFYESGITIAERIFETAAKVTPAELAALCVEARSEYNLRHVPLLLLAALAKTGGALVSETMVKTIQRADELAEFVSIYWRNGKTPLSKQVKKGLALALTKFDAYQLAKYDREKAVRIRDVLFLVHAKPKDEQQAATWKALVDGTLASPDTWEVQLSGGADKRETFERLIREGNLGYLALLRNLRNMADAGCDMGLVRSAILARKGAQKVLPFRYVAAARAAPGFEEVLDQAMTASFDQMPKLAGKTIIVLDVSGSMCASMGKNSVMDRLDAGAALCAVIQGSCADSVIYATAGNDYTRVHATKQISDCRGMALVRALRASIDVLGGGGIFLKPMLEFIHERELQAERIVVITDEQDCAVASRDSPLLARAFGRKNYLVNVGSYKNGVGYGAWTHIDGCSEALVSWIHVTEAESAD